MWYLGATYDPIIIKSGKMIYILIKHIHVEFHHGNKIFKLIMIAKHISSFEPIGNYGAIITKFGNMI